MNGPRLAAFICLTGLVTAGCDGDPSAGGSSAAETPGWNALDWDPIDCLLLPDTSAEVARTPRDRPDLELLALRFSAGIVAETSIYERLVADLAAISALEPEAPTGYRARHDGQKLLVSAVPQTLEQMANGSYSAWNCLNEHYEAQSFENRGHYGLLRLRGTYELARLGDLYARLPGITAAEPDWAIGDGSTIRVMRLGEEWHYVADEASGDCPAGCINHELYYFISEPGGAVRYMDRWTAVPNQKRPSWVEAYWQPTAPVVMSAPSYTLEAGAAGWRGVLEFDYHNVTERPIALLNCRGAFALRLEKRQGPAWVPAWSPAQLMCLSGPIEIPPGGSHHHRLHVFSGYPSSNHGPQFSVDEIDGTYRLVILAAYWDYDHGGPPWGTQVPLADRVSEPFELVAR